MKYFKDPTNNDVFAFEADGSQDEGIPAHLVPIDEAEAHTLAAAINPQPTVEDIKARRQGAYMREADPLFFKAQRGEATMEQWRAKLAEIKARFPLPE